MSRGEKVGGVLLIIGAVQFVLAMIIAAQAWTTPYSAFNNVMSDLGAVYCGYVPPDSSHYVCSPWHAVFNGSVIAMGLLLIAAILLLRRAFAAHWARRWGVSVFVISGLGSMGVGFFPEDVNIRLHTVSALFGFLGGNVALILLGLSMVPGSRWARYRWFTIGLGFLGLVALVLYGLHWWGALGQGGMERLIISPLLLWAVVFGIGVLRAQDSPAPGASPSGHPTLGPP